MKTYDLTLAAEDDLRNIWQFTYETWELDQAGTYLDQIAACSEATPDQGRRSTPLLSGRRERVLSAHLVVYRLLH